MPSQAFRDAAHPEQTGEVFATLLTISHPSLVDPILLTDAGEDITYAADLLDAAGNVAALAGTYLSAPIEVVAPGQSDEQPRGSIRVPNVDQAIGAVIDAITDPLTLTVTVVLMSDTSEIVGGPHQHLELANVRGDALVVEGELSRPSLTVEPWPKHWIRASVFKAAFRL
jgi:hypothetical protein